MSINIICLAINNVAIVAIPVVIIAVAKNSINISFVGVMSCVIVAIAPLRALCMVANVISDMMMSAVPMLPSSVMYFFPVVLSKVLGSHAACAVPMLGNNVVSMSDVTAPIAEMLVLVLDIDISSCVCCSGSFVFVNSVYASVLVPNSPENIMNNGC